MNGVKGLLTSKTVWGVILMIVGMLLNQIIGTDIGDADVNRFTDFIVQAVTLGFEIGGAILAIFGRVRADKKISGLI